MTANKPEYDATIVKLNSLIKELNSCHRRYDLNEANKLLESLRLYSECFYCKTFRKTLENRGWKGCCGDCPCHKVGEYLSGRKRSYNGCYIVGPYKDMVKTAYQFGEDPSLELLNCVILEIHKVLLYMEEFKEMLNE
jgi:hypothetical protein